MTFYHTPFYLNSCHFNVMDASVNKLEAYSL